MSQRLAKVLRSERFKQRLDQKVKSRNARVKPIKEKDWAKERIAQFQSSVTWAAAAKAYRTACGVTQAEVGMEYGGFTGSRVGQWESGHYFGWNKEEFEAWCQVVNRIARSIGTI